MASPYYSGFAGDQSVALPNWIADDQGVAFAQTFGQTKDVALATIKEAIKARWADVARPDALAYQMNERLFYRAPPETDAQVVVRLNSAHDLWIWAGTPTAMINIFAPYGYDTTTCVVVPNWQVILEGNPSWFSRFVILLGRLYWGLDTLWDTPIDTWAEITNETWDSTATIPDLDYMRASVRVMKSPQSYPVVIGAMLLGGTDDGFWDGPSPGVYDDGFLWSDATDGIIYWPLGGVWGDEQWLGGAPVWDDNGLWDDDVFVPPSTGWGRATLT